MLLAKTSTTDRVVKCQGHEHLHHVNCVLAMSNIRIRADHSSSFQAIDLFYSDSAAQSAANGASSKAAASNDKKLGQIWDQYKGVSHLCSSLCVYRSRRE